MTVSPRDVVVGGLFHKSGAVVTLGELENLTPLHYVARVKVTWDKPQLVLLMLKPDTAYECRRMGNDAQMLTWFAKTARHEENVRMDAALRRAATA